MHVLMAWGDVRFSISTLAYDELSRSLAARVSPQAIVGARPTLHHMGLEQETLGLSATLFPYHLPNNRGLSQLHVLRASVGTSELLIAGAGGMGTALDHWVLKSVGDTQTEIHPNGTGQKIAVTLELLYDGRARSPAARVALAGLFG
ncbi:phage tail protein [Roseospira visakhapatnamensis]|uniref:Uncharacterized protein n=1 Tax=Roseospira visakhapatnamensis TaxID=390880 RepID=A0A7W6WAV6_9PROT|nr:phage tail protein [Roseospira visakhapatnamensis]MBB4267364.1 hypothetical protein [Roseospira visakhapatnamensis]